MQFRILKWNAYTQVNGWRKIMYKKLGALAFAVWFLFTSLRINYNNSWAQFGISVFLDNWEVCSDDKCFANIGQTFIQ